MHTRQREGYVAGLTLVLIVGSKPLKHATFRRYRPIHSLSPKVFSVWTSLITDRPSRKGLWEGLEESAGCPLHCLCSFPHLIPALLSRGYVLISLMLALLSGILHVM